ncbi:putative odorant receptor 92a [Zerene cesonia]|uniref:putative odorant receptor 92a n=1 Tax=Zerene cesonia TaxID=33412 RepID=UPI0018E55A95|nr:putative odorant receptor 92a [Zerene cesonia]
MSAKEPPVRQEVIFELDFISSLGRKICLYPFIGKSKPMIMGYFVFYILAATTALQLFLTLVLASASDLLEIINIAPNLGVCIMTVIKYTKLETHKDVYNEIFFHFRDGMWDIVSPNSKIQKSIITKYRKIAMIINRFLLYYSIPLTVVVDSFPYIFMKYEEKFHDLREYLYPFEGWYPFNKIEYYGIVYVWESCMTAVVVIVYLFANMIHASYIVFTCMELRILGCCLEDLISPSDVENIKKGFNVNAIQFGIEKKFKIIIARYEYLAKKCAALDSVLGGAMLLNYSLGAIFICLTAFTCTVVDNSYKRVRYFFMCMSLLVEIFNQCLIGQILSDHSENLTNSIYSSNWIYASPETKKIILMLILRTQKPFEFTGNGYVTMNMNTFSRICSNSYQFFNLLRTMF